MQRQLASPNRFDGVDEPIELSIVIPTFNGWSLLCRCLDTVEKHRPPRSEVIVVDDASTEPIEDRLRQAFPRVRCIRMRRNGGFCRSANAGLAVCRGAVVELLNNDTEVTAGWTEEPMRAFRSPDVGAVAPLVCRLPFRQTIDSAGDNYYWFGMAKKRGEGRRVAPPFDQGCEVFTASASSAFYRRDALRRVGGFPEHFGAYLDDVDLGFRLRLAGYRCWFTPNSRVYHWVSRSYRLRSRRLLHQVSRNSERVFWTNLTPAQLAIYFVPHLIYVLLQLTQKGVRGDFGPWFAGKCAVLAEIPELLRFRWAAQSLVSG